MRRALIGVGVAAALVVSGATSASAAARNAACITPVEFSQVKAGMSKARVAKIVGSKGALEQTSSAEGYTVEIRNYKACKAPKAVVQVQFVSGNELPSQQVGSAYGKVWAEPLV